MASSTEIVRSCRHNTKAIIALALVTIAIASLIGIMSADDTYADNTTIVVGDFEYRYVNESDSEVELYYYHGMDITVDIPSIIHHDDKTLTVVSIGSYAFDSPDAKYYVQGISIPDTVRTLGPGAFKNMRVLFSLWIPINLDASQGAPFEGCNDLMDIHFTTGTGEGHNYTEESVKKTPWYLSRSNLQEVRFEQGITSIGNYTLYDNRFNNWNLSSILTIPHGVTTIGEYAFAKCDRVPQIYLPSTLTEIGTAAFMGCDSITEFTIENGNTSYTVNDGILYNHDVTELIACPANNSLAELNVPASVKMISDCAFYNCTGLTIIDLNTVETIGDRAFVGCTGLTRIHFGLELSQTGNAMFGDMVFMDVDGTTVLDCTADVLRGHIFNKDGDVMLKQAPPTATYLIDDEVVFKDTYLTGTVVTIRENFRLVGHTVTDWSTDSPISITNGKFTIGETDVEFRAYSTVIQYTIAFMDGSEQYWSITQDYGSAVIAPSDPSRIGYTFEGWSPSVPQTVPAENITLHAVWSINQYTITFDSNGGNAVAPITLDFGSTVTAPRDPIKDGNLFLGWYLDDVKYVFDKMPAKNITLHAEWSPRQYTISFTSYGVPIDGYPIIVDHGTVITVPPTVPMIKTNVKVFEFNKWIGFFEGMIATQDMEFPASYTEIYVGVEEEGSGYFLSDDDMDSMTIREEIIDGILKEMKDNPGINVYIDLETGRIELDYESMSKLDNSKTDEVTIRMKERNELPDAVSSVVDTDRPVYKIGVGGISDFNNGTLTIRLNYQLKDGESAENIRIWHFASDGSMVEEECTYSVENGYVEFTTSTLSHFAIVHIEPESYVGLGTTICVILVTIIALSMLVVRRH